MRRAPKTRRRLPRAELDEGRPLLRLEDAAPRRSLGRLLDESCRCYARARGKAGRIGANPAKGTLLLRVKCLGPDALPTLGCWWDCQRSARNAHREPSTRLSTPTVWDAPSFDAMPDASHGAPS